MEWTQVTVTTQSESVEAVSYILNDLGAAGVKIDDAKDFAKLKPGEYGAHGEIIDPKDIPHIATGAAVTAYYPQTVFVPEIIPTIEQRVAQLKEFGLDPGSGAVTSKAVSDENWTTAWKKYYHPVRVASSLTVVPSWEEYQPKQPNEQLIYLDPGMAFGTGTHPTTRLMLQALEMVVRGDETVLDVGTGSGVLSIAAKLLGVSKVYAFDVDDVAVQSAVENLKLNPVASDIHIRPNDLLTGVTQMADLIVANILAEIIVPLIPQAYERLNTGGHFLCSGIIADKVALILNKLQNQGFRVEETLKIGDWYGIIAYKPFSDE